MPRYSPPERRGLKRRGRGRDPEFRELQWAAFHLPDGELEFYAPRHVVEWTGEVLRKAIEDFRDCAPRF